MTLWRRVYTERRRVLLPLMVAALANVAAFLVVVLPLQRSVTRAGADAETATLNLATARQFERQVRTATTSRERADRELELFYQDVLPSSFATAERTMRRWIQQAARETGLTYQTANFDWETVPDSTLSRAFTNVILSGRYADIREFLHLVESADEFLVVEQVELNQSPSLASRGAGTIEVALLVSTFFMTEPAR